MKPAHQETQKMFEEIGRSRGLRTRRSWSTSAPSDGVWLASAVPGVTDLPLVAVEVSCTEGPKALRGSVAVLEEISPALGVLVLHEDQVRRGALADGRSSEEADRKVERLQGIAAQSVLTSRQRLEVWSFEQLQREYRLATGGGSIYELAPKATVGGRPWSGPLRTRNGASLKRL